MDEIETDIKTLLECLKCHRNNTKALCRTLMTLSSFLSTNDEAKEYFLEENGLQYVINLMMNANTTDLKHSTIFCLACAVDKHVLSQIAVTKREIFDFLHLVLKDEDQKSEKIKQTAIFLLLCLVASNGIGQNFARESHCLKDLIALLRNLLESVNRMKTHVSNELWCSTTSALSMCVNNPQNENNQRLCCIILPLSLQCIQEHTNPEFIRPLLALVGLTVANNVSNQDRVRKCGGIELIVCRIIDWIHLVDTDCDFLSLAVNAVSTIDSTISDNENNCKEFMEVNGISVLFTLLKHPDLVSTEKLQVILTLGHALDINTDYSQVLENEDSNILIQLLTETQDEELMKAIKYVLQINNQARSSTKQINQMLEIEQDPNSMILQKITELSNKLDLMETDIKSRKSETMDVDSWLSRNNSNQHGDSSINKPVASHECRLENLDLVDINRDKDKLLRNLRNQNYTEKCIMSPGSIDNFQKNINRNEVDFFTKFTNVLRASFQNVSNNNEENRSIEVASPNLINQIHNSDQYPSRKNYSSNVESCPSPDDWSTHVNDTTHQGFKEDCTSYSYRNNSTVLASCPSHETNLKKNNLERDVITCISCHQRFHSTPKGKVQDANKDYQTECLLKHVPCIHSDLLHLPTQSPICYGTDANTALQESLLSRSSHCTINSTQNNAPGKHVIFQKEEEPIYKQAHNDPHYVGDSMSNPIVPADKVVPVKQTTKDAFTEVQTDLKDTEATSLSLVDMFDLPNATTGIKTRKYTHGVQLIVKQQELVDENNSAETLNLQTLHKTPHIPPDLELIKAIEEGSREKLAPELFAKPVVPPFRRRIRHTPILGSVSVGKASLRNTVSRMNQIVTEESVLPREYPCPSPALSEFDFRLVQTAKSGYAIQNDGLASCSESYVGNLNSVNNIINMKTSSDGSCYSSLSSTSEKSRLSEPDSDEELLTTCEGSEYYKTANRINTRQFLNSVCPGCQHKDKNTVLNSRTYNIVLESSLYTCRFHRQVRSAERDYIKNVKQELSHKISKQSYQKNQLYTADCKNIDVYEFTSSCSSSDQKKVSPPNANDSVRIPRTRLNGCQERRKRVPYSEEEIDNLIDGVETIGKYWNQILITYKFHPSRTSVDLKDKYRRINNEDKSCRNKKRRVPRPFSMCEERRLKRGIKVLGYNWKGILNSYKFFSERTAEDLRNKWRSLNK